jgi:hypothetical protein
MSIVVKYRSAISVIMLLFVSESGKGRGEHGEGGGGLCAGGGGRKEHNRRSTRPLMKPSVVGVVRISLQFRHAMPHGNSADP